MGVNIKTKKNQEAAISTLQAPEDDSDELDEAIRHCDEIVQDITWFCNSPSKYIEQRRHESAVKLRQLTSWLRELKRLRTEVYFLKAERENTPVDLLGDVPCKTCKWRVTTTEKCEECIDGVSDNYEVQEPCEDCVSRQAAIDAAWNTIPSDWFDILAPKLEALPSAQPTLCGYDIEHLILIADVLRKENLPPERVVEALTDIGQIVSIVKDEFEESLRKSVEQSLNVGNSF